MGWFSDAVSSIGDFFTAPISTVSDTVQHASDVATNNPVLTAAAIAGAAYASGGASLAVTAPEAATIALESQAAAEATAAATADLAGGLIPQAASSGFTLSQVAGAAGDVIKAGGTVVSALSLANSRPTVSRLNSGLGVNYISTPQITSQSGAVKAGGDGTGGDSAGAVTRDILATQTNKTLDNKTLLGYALGAILLYGVIKK